jgi:rhodanese-related sulfurtransferase
MRVVIVDLEREDIKARLAEGSILLVDVREPHEFAAGHIPGSVSMPLSSFHPADLPEAGERDIVFSCAAGVRSRNALMMAQASGLPLEAHYVGGFKDWAMAGEEIAFED